MSVENYKNMKAYKWAELVFEMGLIEAKTPNFDEDEKMVGGPRDSKIWKNHISHLVKMEKNLYLTRTT